MKEVIRIDKYLCDMGIGTRSEVKAYIKKGRIKVNHSVIKKSDHKVHIGTDQIQWDEQIIQYKKFEYYMLNKPQGVVSATYDNLHTTVVELIVTTNKMNLFPVGRLDKDTEGLLLITNDGQLAHELLSPKKKVGKVYYAQIQGEVTQEDIKLFQQGITIEEGFTTSPAILTILHQGSISEIEVTIFEGKFHQVKRMFHAVGKEVIYLKRLAMGNLRLDPSLSAGEFRSLTEEELQSIKGVL